MTKNEQLQAGRELDALIAEKVMGWTPPKDQNGSWIYPDGEIRQIAVFGPWAFSTNITFAWLVVEQADLTVGRYDATNWYAECYLARPVNGARRIQEIGETAPLAICRAALRALGIEVTA